MSLTTTEDCKKFLDIELKLEKSNWKRKRKSKNAQGEIERVFECLINDIQALVVESSGSLFLDSQTPLTAGKNLSTATQSTKDIKPPQPQNSISVSEKSLQVFKEFVVLIMSYDWGSFVFNDIEGPKGQSLETQEFSQIIRTTFDKFYALSAQEKKEFAFLQKNNTNDLLETFISHVGEMVKSLTDLDETYAPYYLSRNFKKESIGVIESAELIQTLSQIYAEQGIPLSKKTPHKLKDTQRTLIYQFEDALNYTDETHNPEEAEKTIKEAIKIWTTFPQELTIKAERYALDKNLASSKQHTLSTQDLQKELNKIFKL